MYVLACLFARCVNDETLRGLRSCCLDIECIQTVPPLCEEIDANGVETQETVDQGTEVRAFGKMSGKSADGETDMSSQYSKHGSIQ